MAPNGWIAAIAVRSLLPKQLTDISTAHLHAPLVSVKEQTLIIVERMSNVQKMTFKELVIDCETTGHVVARFLGILELLRQRLINFTQDVPLGPLHLVWLGDETTKIEIDTEFDEEGQAEQVDE